MNRTTIISALATAAAAVALLPNCGALESCTDLGCGSAFTVEFAGGIFAGGDYEIVVTADGVTTTCAVTLPFPSCTDNVSCDRSDPSFLVERADCGGGLERIEGILFPIAAPAQIAVEVRRASTVLGSGSYQPTYTTTHPNGADCEPTCQQGSPPGSLMLDWSEN